MNILITGGAGFVGSSLARSFKVADPTCRITVFDNLKRRGSEFNLADFREMGIYFVHGDIRSPSDFNQLAGSDFDVLVEASAEPSVLAGTDGESRYLFETNLGGTYNCLEFARKHVQRVIFISTSRVYSIPDLLEVPLREDPTRYEIDSQAELPAGLSEAGIAENFSTERFRSLYGMTKRASEMLIQEYCAQFDLEAVINRCGVIAGPGQWGKTDQGVFSLWVANHFFQKPLTYTGFNGLGKQVRDLLHPLDLFDLLEKQIVDMGDGSGEIYNVGGGHAHSVSLMEYTQICRTVVGHEISIGSRPDTASVDIPYYVSDNKQVEKRYDWKPTRDPQLIVTQIAGWLEQNQRLLKDFF
ncbi:MAG: NAD-dependent epimerase/dehydratase family protein [Desulfobulbaceae bacterium]|nr:MAG: NAD-dependent epimerase/dehydratase family protein [Desulfobulbaceae bacterium]